LKLVIIDSYDSFTFNLLQMLGEILGERPIVFKNDEVGPREIEAAAPGGVVLSPGPGHPRDAGRLVEIVQGLDPSIPILGVCLGHQAIVEAEGGRVVGAGTIVHGKTSEVVHQGGVLFDGVPSPFDATRYHSLVAETATLPKTLRVNAHTLDGLIMGIEHVKRPIFGVQFHPESIATGVGGTILENFAAFCRRKRPSVAPRKTMRSAGIGPVLERVLAGVTLSRDVARSIAERILQGQLTPAQIGALSIALSTKGESADEVAGFALAFRNAMESLPVLSKPVVNIAGTGADGASTFNISTAASFVIAGAGVAVAKTVDVAKGSLCGSADVVRALGLRLHEAADDHDEATHADSTRLLEEVGLAFFSAGAGEPAAFRNVPTVAEIGARTIFGLVAPLINVAGAKRHVIGVYSNPARDVVVRALRALGAERALVIYARDGMDELTTTGASHISELEADGRTIVERTLHPQDLGLPRASPEEYAGGDAGTNARIITSILGGARGPQRDVVALNAAAGLYVGGAVKDLQAGLSKAFESIDSGAAREVLERLRAEKKKKKKVP
jgi:anthranilate synthase/phosphoribosyltransferase